MAEEQNNKPCYPDHDRLLALEVRFDEYRHNMEARLEKLNELRGQVEADRLMYLRSDVYTVKHDTLSGEVDALDQRMTGRINTIENWEARITGIGIVLITLASLLGVFVGRVWK